MAFKMSAGVVMALFFGLAAGASVAAASSNSEESSSYRECGDQRHKCSNDGREWCCNNDEECDYVRNDCKK